MEYLNNLLALSLDSAPWLVLGLIVAGLIKAWMKDEWLAGQLGGKGIGSIIKSALIGTPLPLCSCSVIPVAMGIRRSGASKSSTVSFLVATPETGADSIALSYALLGPVMAIVRPIAAIFSAVFAGVLVTLFDVETPPAVKEKSTEPEGSSCCSKSSSCSAKEPPPSPSAFKKMQSGLSFAFTSIFDDFIKWLFIGLLFAALVKTYVPESFLIEWGSGIVAMLVMIAVGVPMYICATASTPIAAALMIAGVSPGTALVFLLAGPATNMATLAVVSQELGKRSLLLYLVGMGGASLISGLALDAILNIYDINIAAQLSGTHEMLPSWLAWGSFLFIMALVANSLRKRLLG